MFRRRDRLPLSARIREFMLPRTGWRRALEYMGHRVRRIPDTPHRIALGFACGVLVSFTPLFGLHLFLAAALAWALRCNVAASLIGTLVGNPATFPAIAGLSLSLGRRILGYGATGRDFGRITRAFAEAVDGLWAGLRSAFGYGAPEWDKVRVFVVEVLWPYTVGGLGPGLVAAAASYWLIRAFVAGYQSARRAPPRRAPCVARGPGGRLRTCWRGRLSAAAEPSVRRATASARAGSSSDRAARATPNPKLRICFPGSQNLRLIGSDERRAQSDASAGPP